MKTKTKTEILHEIEHHVQGDEPFLSWRRAHMVVNLSAGMNGSHNFSETFVTPSSWPGKGDILAFQIVRLSQVPMTWYERVWSWVKGLK